MFFKLSYIKFQNACHYIKETSRARCALVVHQKIDRSAIFDIDIFCILSAYIYNGAVAACHFIAAPAVARYLGHNAVGIPDAYAPVACCYDSGIIYIPVLLYKVIPDDARGYLAVPACRQTP